MIRFFFLLLFLSGARIPFELYIPKSQHVRESTRIPLLHFEFAVNSVTKPVRQPHLLIGGHAFSERQAGPERAPTEQVAAWINIYGAKAVYPAQFHVDVFA